MSICIILKAENIAYTLIFIWIMTLKPAATSEVQALAISSIPVIDPMFMLSKFGVSTGIIGVVFAVGEASGVGAAIFLKIRVCTYY